MLSEAYWPADTSVAIRDITVGEMLREAAADSPDKTAMVSGVPGDDRRWTFAELLGDAETVARALLGVFEPGERVAVWAPNVPEWILLEFGMALAGLTLVTVNPAYQPNELAYVLRQSQASGIFLVPEFRGNPMLASLESVRAELPELRHVLLFTQWDEFCKAGSDRGLPAVAPTDPAQIQYTSGTTGFPKGALLHHRGLTNNAALFADAMGLGPSDVDVDPMPMFHTAGCVLGVLGMLAARATHVPVLAFEPGHVLELIERERATVFAGVPTMLIASMAHADFAKRDLSSLRVAMSGGSLVPAALVRRIESELGVRFCIVYGTTECSPLITQTRPDDTAEDKAETVGRPLPQTEVKVIDPISGAVVRPGDVGELCARGYLVMTGYFDMPDATAEAIDADGWYHTGDLASMDERGYCRIEGRLKDMIIRGGENIYPREIEDVLFAHPDVAEIAVVGIPDDKWGEVVAAFVRCAPGSTLNTAALRTHLREHLAPFKTPTHWIAVDAFPLTGSGKIQKFVLRDQFVGGHLRSL
jgi:acyl-CoA synthetase (AMP-forming)/AMP-acid ligase II